METLEMESGPVAAPKRLAGACTMVFVLSILQLLGTVCYVLMVVPMVLMASVRAFGAPEISVLKLRSLFTVVLLLLGVLCVVPLLSILDSVLAIAVGALWRQEKGEGLLKQARRVSRSMALHMALHSCITLFGVITLVRTIISQVKIAVSHREVWEAVPGYVVFAPFVGCEALQCIAVLEIYRFTSMHGQNACTQTAKAWASFMEASLICGLLVGSLLQVETSFLLNGDRTVQTSWDTHGTVAYRASNLVGLIWEPFLGIAGTVVAVALLASNSDQQDQKWLKRLRHLADANICTIAVCVPVPLLFDIRNFWMNVGSFWTRATFWALCREPLYTVVLLGALVWITRNCVPARL